jgi:hypothetical protein
MTVVRCMPGPHGRWKPQAIFVRLIASFLVVALPAAAGSYWRPRVEAGAGYDDNIRMAYDAPGQVIDESPLYQTQVDAELGIDSGAAQSTLFGRYWYQSATSNHDLDADIAQIRLNHTRSTERSTLTLEVDAQYDTTLTSEFAGSGIYEKRDRHNFRNKLGYRWQLTELDYVNGEVNTENVRYIDAEDAGLNDYDTRSVTASYGHSLSERANAGAQLVYSEFDIPDLHTGGALPRSYETDNVIAVAFGDYGFGERDKISIQVGFRKSNFYDEVGPFLFKEDGTGQVFSASYSRGFDASNLQLSASRDLRPNGSGAIVEQDSIGVSIRHGFDARLSLNSALSGNRQREPAQRTQGLVNTSTEGHDFAQLSVGFQYAASEQHSLALELNRRWQRDNASKYEANNTAIFLRWYWNPPQTML